MTNMKEFLRAILVDGLDGYELRNRALLAYVELSNEPGLFVLVYFDNGARKVQIDPTIHATVESYLRQGQKINAIKELRVALGVGLKEAKDTVDNWTFLRP